MMSDKTSGQSKDVLERESAELSDTEAAEVSGGFLLFGKRKTCSVCKTLLTNGTWCPKCKKNMNTIDL